MYLFLLFVVFAVYHVQAVRECERITIDDLRSTDNNLRSNLLVQTYNPNVNPSDPSIIVEEMNIVCEAPGTKRDTYRFVSIVVSQICSGFRCNDETNGASTLVQYDFECDSNNKWIARALGSNEENIRDENPMADLDTEAVDGCSGCAMTFSRADDITHCTKCPIECDEGLKKCDGFGSSECCNFYLEDQCVAECPEDTHTANDDYDCIELVECPALSNPDNGTVEYEDDRFYPSIAVYECAQGFELDGDAERQCEIEGEWAGDPPECIADSKSDGGGSGGEDGMDEGGDGSDEGDGMDEEGETTSSSQSSGRGLTNAEIGIIVGVTVLLFFIIVGVFITLIAVWACS